MDLKEYIKLASHYDKIGAFTAADELEKEFVKLAQVPERDSALQGSEPRSPGSGLENFYNLFTIGAGRIFNSDSPDKMIPYSMKVNQSFITRLTSYTDFVKKLKEANKLLYDKGKIGRAHV